MASGVVGFVGSYGKDAGKSAVIKFAGLVLLAVLIHLDASVLEGTILGVAADDVVIDIDEVDHLIRAFVGDGSAENGEVGYFGKVAFW